VPYPHEFIPRPAEAVDLPLDALALRVLAYAGAVDDAGDHVTRNIATNRNWWGEYEPMGELAQPFLPALVEAWDWLYGHGLVSGADPRQAGADWAFLTHRGRAFLDDPDARARLRAEGRLDVDLHPLIAARVRAQWSLGEYEPAAFLAMRQVEVRVRDVSGAPAGDLGVPLMQASFKEGGPLADPKLESGEQQATMALFWGAVGVFKNPISHRPVEYGDPTVASEVILLADLLLRLLEETAGRVRMAP
jgi:uncharacterized protein (TIGR02391 family)